MAGTTCSDTITHKTNKHTTKQKTKNTRKKGKRERSFPGDHIGERGEKFFPQIKEYYYGNGTLKGQVERKQSSSKERCFWGRWQTWSDFNKLKRHQNP